MIRLSRLADYAVVITGYMAAQPGRVFSAFELADGTGLPAPTVSKVLTALGRAKVVRSLRGVKGGYQLARAPKEITAGDIIVAVDGPIALTLCLEHDRACDVASICPSRQGWRKVNEAILRALQAVTLADMTSPFGIGLRPEPAAPTPIATTLTPASS